MKPLCVDEYMFFPFSTCLQNTCASTIHMYVYYYMREKKKNFSNLDGEEKRKRVCTTVAECMTKSECVTDAQ